MWMCNVQAIVFGVHLIDQRPKFVCLYKSMDLIIKYVQCETWNSLFCKDYCTAKIIL